MPTCRFQVQIKKVMIKLEHSYKLVQYVTRFGVTIHKTLLYIIDAKHLTKSTYPIYFFLYLHFYCIVTCILVRVMKIYHECIMKASKVCHLANQAYKTIIIY